MQVENIMNYREVGLAQCRGGALDLKPYAGITNVEGGASSERQGRYRGR